MGADKEKGREDKDKVEGGTEQLGGRILTGNNSNNSLSAGRQHFSVCVFGVTYRLN